MCNKMSDVRLSNASPTVERVDARQPDSARSVRRVLFGTPDPEETRRQAEALQQQAVEDFRERYNFDPVEDIPLSPGDYEWVEDEDPPEFYRRPPRGSEPTGENSPERCRGRRTAHTNGSRKRSADSAGYCSDECTSKKKAKSHSDKDGDDEGAGSQTAKRSSRSEEEEEENPYSAVPEH